MDEDILQKAVCHYVRINIYYYFFFLQIHPTGMRIKIYAAILLVVTLPYVLSQVNNLTYKMFCTTHT